MVFLPLLILNKLILNWISNLNLDYNQKGITDYWSNTVQIYMSKYLPNIERVAYFVQPLRFALPLFVNAQDQWKNIKQKPDEQNMA